MKEGNGSCTRKVVQPPNPYLATLGCIGRSDRSGRGTGWTGTRDGGESEGDSEGGSGGSDGDGIDGRERAGDAKLKAKARAKAKQGAAARQQQELRIPPDTAADEWLVLCDGAVLSPRGANEKPVRVPLAPTVMLEPGETVVLYVHSSSPCSYGFAVPHATGDSVVGHEDDALQLLAAFPTRSIVPFEVVCLRAVSFAGRVEYKALGGEG